MDKLKMHSLDQSQANIGKIRELFPSCVTEGPDEVTGQLRLAVDFDKLRQELSDHIVEGLQERYHLDWPGKREALALANTPIAKTLRPCREESVEFDTTKNLFIEGDNLDALKLLQETYFNQIKMIYIDPPYNTGKDFIYRDKFKTTQVEQEYISGERDINSNRLVANSENNGRFHTVWLKMLYPRIKIARNLLTEDGIFFMSLDDNEVHNGLKICEEIFGTQQFIACLPTIMNLKGNNDQLAFAGTHEYTLAFAKNKSNLKVGEFTLDDEEIEEWKEDHIGPYKRGANLKATGQNAPRHKRPHLFFPLYITDNDEIYVEQPTQPHAVIQPLTDGVEMSWRWNKDKFKHNPDDTIIVRSESSLSIYKKQRPKLGDIPSRKPKTTFYKPEYSSGNGTAAMKELFGSKFFDAPPKPLTLIEDLIEIGCPNGGIVLDFFAGSGTTGHAVLTSCQKTEKKLSFILVQIAESTPESSEARAQGYTTIADISKERIRRVGNKMLEAPPPPPWNRDVGFRVLKVDSSNIKEVSYRPTELKQTYLPDIVDNVKKDRSAEDLLFQVLVDWGVDLTLPIRSEVVQGKNIFTVDNNALVACFDLDVTEELAEELAALEPSRVIFQDSGFISDAVKINVEQIFRQLSPTSEVKTI